MSTPEIITLGEGDETIKLERKCIHGINVYVPTPEQERELDRLYREMILAPDPPKRKTHK